jgi:hypothetical protein
MVELGMILIALVTGFISYWSGVRAEQTHSMYWRAKYFQAVGRKNHQQYSESL